MMKAMKVTVTLEIEEEFIEKFKQACEYVKQHEDEVFSAGHMSVVEKFFNDDDIDVFGSTVLQNMLPDIDEEACANR